MDKILVVDDNIVNRKMLGAILEKAGYDVIEAVDGEEAVNLSMQEIPDLILLDIMMPNKDGYEACVEIKQHVKTTDVPIIFLSARTQTRDKVKGLELGGVDYVTKPFSKDEVLARVNAQLKIRHLTEDLKKANEDLLSNQIRMEQDLRSAGKIQQSLLPKDNLKIKGLDIAWRFVPCDTLGGDIFNIFQLSEDYVSAYMLDVSGHGVPSALVTVSASQILQPQTGHLLKRSIVPYPHYEVVSPAHVLGILDEEFPIERFDKYFTISYLLFNSKDGSLKYSSAAHPPPVLIRRDGSLELLEEGGTIIGMGGLLPFSEGDILLEPGDKLFLYTDGVIEYEIAEEVYYGEERLYDRLLELKNEKISDIVDGVIDSMMEFGGNISPKDDVSLLGFEYLGHSS